MEYRKSDADTWTDGTGVEITGLEPGTYQIRIKETETALPSDLLELKINGTLPRAATPVMNPKGGEYAEAQNVEITCETAGATIYYTTDGTKPEPGTNGAVYSGPLTVSATTTIKAVAIGEGTAKSDVATATYTLPVILTLRFDANGGEGTMDPLSVKEGDTVSLTANAFTRTNHTFAAWNTAADGSGVSYTDGQSVQPTADLNLYAQWKENTRFYANDGTETYKVKKYVTSKKAVTLSWSKNVKASGYEIQYSTGQKFEKSRTTSVTVNSKKIGLKITDLKSGKKWYFRVRCYKMNGSKKNYSAWRSTVHTTLKK